MEYTPGIVRALLEHDGDIVPRDYLRAHMPELGPKTRHLPSQMARKQAGKTTSSRGSRESSKLAEVIRRLENRGLVRRVGDDVVVLDRAELERMQKSS